MVHGVPYLSYYNILQLFVNFFTKFQHTKIRFLFLRVTILSVLLSSVVKKKRHLASSKDFLRACVLKNFGFAERPQQFKRLRHKSVVRDSGAAAAQLCASNDPL